MIEQGVMFANPIPEAESAGDGVTRPTRERLLGARPSDAEVPLSWEQEQIWLHGLLFPDAALYNETITICYRGKWQHKAFTAALDEICRRHEIWRTTIQEQQGRPVQVVGSPRPNSCSIH